MSLLNPAQQITLKKKKKKKSQGCYTSEVFFFILKWLLSKLIHDGFLTQYIGFSPVSFTYRHWLLIFLHQVHLQFVHTYI